MKRFTTTFFLLMFLFGNAAFLLAEETSIKSNDGEEFDLTQPLTQENVIGAYFGYTNVGNQSYIGLRLEPDLNFGKLGIGLDIPVMFNVKDGKFRTDEYKDGVAWLRMIRSLSWGVKKQDPLYLKFGKLNGAYLGYGMLINNYLNSPSYEKRKVGAEIDYCYKDFIGIEALYSDFNMKSLNLLGVRPYIKPLNFTGIPIIKTLDIGLQYVTDHDKTGNVISTDLNSNHNTFLGSQGMNAYAMDMGITLINMRSARLVLFASGAMLQKNTNPAFMDSVAKRSTTTEFVEAAQNYKNGYGASAGIDFKFKFLGNMVRLDTRLERLWHSDYFIPQFFDVSYEINKDERIMSLINAKQMKGIYGYLGASVLDKIKVGGGLMLPDEISEANPALLRLDLDGSEIMDNIVLRGSYIKGGLTNLERAFTLDGNSLLYLRAGYKLYSFMMVGVDYRWTWAANSEGKYVPSSYWAPFVGFSLDLPF